MKDKLSNFTEKLANFFATWFYSGLLPKAPGTFGTIASVPFVYLVATYLGFWGLFAFLIMVFAIGYTAIEVITIGKEDKDQQKIVIDETVGIIITFLFIVPYLSFYPWLYLAGFVLFRVFDIYKFGLVKHFDMQNNALGVLLDDVFAGINAGLILFFFCYFFL